MHLRGATVEWIERGADGVDVYRSQFCAGPEQLWVLLEVLAQQCADGGCDVKLHASVEPRE